MAKNKEQKVVVNFCLRCEPDFRWQVRLAAAERCLTVGEFVRQAIEAFIAAPAPPALQSNGAKSDNSQTS